MVGTLTGLLLRRLWRRLGRPRARRRLERLGSPTQLMISLGAGIYEELLFRVLLVGTLAWVAPAAASAGAPRRPASSRRWSARSIFSAFHYIGPYGDRLELGSFTFRAIAGVLFSGLYLLRGFGITAWTHALYDVFLAVSA